MNLRILALRNLKHYWRTNLAVTAGIATAMAVLSGALLVGESVRASLRDLLIQRLGNTQQILTSDRFVREQLSDSLENTATGPSCPVIYTQGVLIHEKSHARALNVNVFGVDHRFWQMQRAPEPQNQGNRSAALGSALAKRLGAQEGDGLLLRIETQQGVPKESLFGRRENTGRTLRLDCSAILNPENLGELSLIPSQGAVYTMFVPLERLQRDLGQLGRANMILFGAGSSPKAADMISHLLGENFTLEDAGIKLRDLHGGSALSVESSQILLDEPVVRAAFGAAKQAGFEASGIFSYLANAIRVHGREIPYSVITAADFGAGTLSDVKMPKDSTAVPNRIWLTDWAARDVGSFPGDSVEVDYYAWKEDGRLATETATFSLAGTVPIGGDIDATLAPEIPGITEARSINQWDPPFPLDLRRIRPKDEEYWSWYRATPKAVIRLNEGQALWKNRFGNLSAVRIALPAGQDHELARRIIAALIRDRIRPESVGFRINSVRQQGLAASRGSTDFSEYFVYFSFFLIASAALLSALFFRLGVEQRVREIGILRSLGFSAHDLRKQFLLEGLALSSAGILIGIPAAYGYGSLLVLGLRTWWIGAVGTQQLRLHASWQDLAWGGAAALVVMLVAVTWTLHGLGRNSPRALLTGVLESTSFRIRKSRLLTVACISALVAGLGLLMASTEGKVGQVEAFFGAGLLLLISLLCAASNYLRRSNPVLISGRGWRAQFRLGARNAMHRPGRSLLCIALIASATFIIVSMEAFRQDPVAISVGSHSGTGGYALIAESELPIIYDPNSAAGRDALGITASEAPEMQGVRFTAFRERPGEDTSCLNLYSPREPRILGAPHSFLSAARFVFQDSQGQTAEQKFNPWLLLETTLADGAVPAIGDANTIQYILHSGIGQDISIRTDDNRPAKLRFIAALQGSILQGELLISETNFLHLFPHREGYRFFLIDAPVQNAASLAQPMMEKLADWGFDVETTRDRLAAYRRVENTYLSTFQALGALGLVLGTIGLATVLLRNVLERRQELALLRAVGYRKRTLSAMILAENAFLIVVGLTCGTVCALLAIGPALISRGGSYPILITGMILGSVLAVGFTASILAVVAALRSPLLPALRSE